MNVELNASVVIDDWQAVVNRTVSNYFDSLGFEHLDQVLDMRVFDLLNMNLLDAVRVEEIIVCLYRSLNPNITVDEAMYCGHAVDLEIRLLLPLCARLRARPD